MPLESVKPYSPLPDFSPWFVSFGHWLANAIVNIYPHFVQIIKNLYGMAVGLSIVMCLVFFLGIIYCVESLKRIRNKEEEMFTAKVEPGFEDVKGGDAVMSKRWKKALAHIDSENPNDWKQAIIEADIILDDILNKLGYRGDTIGDKLARVAEGDMRSLKEAKEAHWVRNQIAHQSDYSINHHEAKNVIGMYRKVFEEFYYV